MKTLILFLIGALCLASAAFGGNLKKNSTLSPSLKIANSSIANKLQNLNTTAALNKINKPSPSHQFGGNLKKTSSVPNTSTKRWVPKPTTEFLAYVDCLTNCSKPNWEEIAETAASSFANGAMVGITLNRTSATFDFSDCSCSSKLEAAKKAQPSQAELEEQCKSP